ncbi:CynX/NimT family MFS transporter [Salibacterium halotolerans]|uniref:MFS transporter, CP family, cyanate transporter n=1 Tax=Salibacterium halotolerans TaxID=1884432 RepID=A0A1I5RRD3_9BACI|nr:MFS transporter [Salibacterium halotolerans]SFP61109.1 MFS transporter, CP family, cyanate transporter [Salibacterium halotolerans]
MNEQRNPWKTPQNVMLILGIVFIAFNLRPAITSVGPLIGIIRGDTGISNGAAGLLNTLPLLAFAALSPLAPAAGQRFGKEKIVYAGLLLLTAGIVLRAAGVLPAVYAGTAMAGGGIAIGNVLLPGVVKERFPQHVGTMTGVYTTSMVLFASAASGLSLPLTNGLDLPWNISLGAWALLCVPALLLWLPQLKVKQDQSSRAAQQEKETPVWRSPLAWQVTFFMGLQSFLFYCLITWLPEILQARGMDAAAAGWLLSLMQFVSLPLSFFIPVLAARLPHQKGIVAGISILYTAGLAGLFIHGSVPVLVLCVILFGLAQGGALSLSLTLLGLRAQTASQASRLSGMAQSLGYLLAAVGPFSAGVLFDMYQSWTSVIVIFIVVTAAMFWTGTKAGEDRYILSS